MLLGLISDTHDEVEPVQAAVRLFSRLDCGFIIHLGDFTQPRVLREFGQRRAGRFGWIPGNEDDFGALHSESDTVGGEVLGEKRKEAGVGLLTLKDNKIGLCHSTYEPNEAGGRNWILAWVRGGQLSHVFYGHLHYFNVRFPTPAQPTTLINPGGSYKTVKPWTVCTLDLDEGVCDFFVFDGAAKDYRHGLTISVRNRSCLYGEASEILIDGINETRRQKPRFWSHADSKWLADEPRSWLQIDSLVLRQPFV